MEVGGVDGDGVRWWGEWRMKEIEFGDNFRSMLQKTDFKIWELF